jgi:pyridoxine 5-phosphate synthase
MAAGASGITVHLREDRRHVRDADVRALRDRHQGLLNLEMAATSEMARIAGEIVPQVVTLVPENREERTTEGGLDVRRSAKSIAQVAAVCQDKGIKLSLFIEASLDQVKRSREAGAQQVEFHTGHYCEAPEAERPMLLTSMREAARLARELGLEVAAGHGLNCENVAPVVAIEAIEELNIGHSVVCDAVLVGLAEAVRRLHRVIVDARG